MSFIIVAKRNLNILLVAFVFLTVNVSICDAVPIYPSPTYSTGDEDFPPEVHIYYSKVVDDFFNQNKNIGILISKCSTPYRQEGLNIITDRIKYFYDPGKVNRVIKNVISTMLIRITTTTGEAYDFYPSSLYITYAKKVADWSLR